MDAIPMITVFASGVPPLSVWRDLLLTSVFSLCSSFLYGQFPASNIGEPVPRDVREIYFKGLKYLAASQQENGTLGKQSSYNGSGVTGMALMTFLASGEDPNFGIYSGNIRRGLRSIIKSQDANTGILGGVGGHTSMYNHGFGMLALAEAYGAVDESNLWPGGNSGHRGVGQALELAVRGAVTSQKKNRFGGWRYGPDATDADTSVSGAVMVGLLAARNAGIEVPDEAIDRGVAYFKSMTSSSGQVAYSGVGGFGESVPRTSIACLVYAVSRRKDMPEFQATLTSLSDRLQQSSGAYKRYGDYYRAQALFQGDVEAWEKWNESLVRELKASQNEDGSFSGQYGPSVETSLSLLAMALNFRFLPIYER
ncbi:MAG: prenyltransferase/squalene oxidase repeat-containing protein [Planctomycetota bacterium]